MSNDDSLVTPSSCFKRALLLGLMRERLKNSVEKCELNFWRKIEENLSSFLIWNLSLSLSFCPYNPPFFLFFWVRESDIIHKISSRYLFFSFFPALLHCSLLLLLLNTLAKKSLAFIYIFIYIYKYNSTFVNDDKTFSFFFLLSVSFNRKRRERSHQSINQIRKVGWLLSVKKISKSKSPTHLNKQDINKYVSTNNVWNLLETVLDRVRVTRGIGRSFRFGPSFGTMSVQEK